MVMTADELDAQLRGSQHERTVAIRTVLTEDTEGARERFAPYLGDPRFVYDLLYTTFREGTRFRIPRWLVEVAIRADRDASDPQYFAWAFPHARERLPREFRSMLRDLLRLYADKQLVADVKKQLGIAKPAKPKATPKAERDAMLARAREEVAPLCAALDAIVQRLAALDYQLVAKRGVTPAAKNAKTRLGALEKQVGPLPATVRAFYELVDGVDLRGTCRTWPRTGSVELAPEPYWLIDPLVVLPLAAAADDAADHPRGEPFALPLVPEPLAKAGFSAGSPFTVRCGEPIAYDPPLDGDPAKRTFLGYLREATAWSGLPGFATIADAPRELVRALHAT